MFVSLRAPTDYIRNRYKAGNNNSRGIKAVVVSSGTPSSSSSWCRGGRGISPVPSVGRPAFKKVPFQTQHDLMRVHISGRKRSNKGFYSSVVWARAVVVVVNVMMRFAGNSAEYDLSCSLSRESTLFQVVCVAVWSRFDRKEVVLATLIKPQWLVGRIFS